MIYTVTLNPSLDYIISLDHFEPGMTNRATDGHMVAGGKGINVSIVLKNLGMDSIALGFTAGFIGEEIERQLRDRGIKTDFVHIPDGVSRVNVKLVSMDGTEINGTGPKIGQEQIELLLGKLDDLHAGDVLILSGSIPPSVPSDIYGGIMERTSGKNVRIVADASGTQLEDMVRHSPFLIKPNHHEIGQLFHTEIRTRDEAVPYGRRLQEMGARNVLISLAGEGAVFVGEDGLVLMEEAPAGKVRNSVGAGDSMIAGFMAGYLESREVEYAFYRGLAAGSASAFSGDLCTREEIDAIYNKLLKGRD